MLYVICYIHIYVYMFKKLLLRSETGATCLILTPEDNIYI